MLPVIFSLARPELTETEAAFFREAQPAGFILFNRNVTGRDQIRRLTGDLHDCLGRDRVPIMIDQEGGRVQMLARPPNGLMEAFADIIGRSVNPEFATFPAPGDFGRLYAKDARAGVRAAHLNARLIAAELFDCGITVNCAPTLDVPVAGAHQIIGDRAFGNDPITVINLARAVMHGFRLQGVAPVIKHIPGHGRAVVDSHVSLPRVTEPLENLQVTDFAPFKELAEAPFAMTAHIIYDAFDRVLPATISAETIRKGIRGHCGFNGVLLTDAIEMGALSGDLPERCLSAINAGCDAALYCLGRVPHMENIASALPRASAETTARFDLAMMWGARLPAKADFKAFRVERDRLLSQI